MSTVRSFLRHTVRDGRAETNPAEGIPSPKVPRPLPSTLTVDEMFNLLDRIRADDPASLRDRAILELLEHHLRKVFGKLEIALREFHLQQLEQRGE